MSTVPMREQVETYVKRLQEEIVTSFETLDSQSPKFLRDSWTRSQGGSGQSCVFSSGDSTVSILEKAGVNISIVHGMLPPKAIQQMRADHADIPFDAANPVSLPFFAAGLSLVIHPRNPMAPTVHMNVRYFEITSPEAEKEGQVISWWFGGGTDLTPTYLFEDDARHFHQTLKDACDKHSTELYPPFKKWCDEYFQIPHRGEARGIGGIFFDDLSSQPHAKLNSQRPTTADEIFAFVKSLGDAFVPSYMPILKRRLSEPSNERNRRWQLIRRGRYVEFNLVYDRGTKFGLATPGARIESVLMSLPETARWEYMSELGQDGEELKIVNVLKNPVDWV